MLFESNLKAECVASSSKGEYHKQRGIHRECDAVQLESGVCRGHCRRNVVDRWPALVHCITSATLGSLKTHCGASYKEWRLLTRILVWSRKHDAVLKEKFLWTPCILWATFICPGALSTVAWPQSSPNAH